LVSHQSREEMSRKDLRSEQEKEERSEQVKIIERIKS
jgi:hypothetical protein